MIKLKVNFSEHDEHKINLIKNEYNLSDISAQVVLNRGLNSHDEIESYLHPKMENLEDTYDFKDLDRGCTRLIESINRHEKILVYGDYDVDGTTSVSQMLIFLEKVGADVDYYIPHRENEGYGISDEFIEMCQIHKFDLLITVDCGISEAEKIDKLNELGYETIIIDHHTVGDRVPNAYAVVNPKQDDCRSKNKDLCASGLTFKFLMHLNKYFKLEGIEDKLIELACLGTVADIVTLLGDNRIITYYGLKALNNSKIVGIRELVKACCGEETVNSKMIGFRIAPKINAAGRMKSASIAVDLMISKDDIQAKKLAAELISLNDLRKETENEILNQAIKQITDKSLDKQHVIIVHGENWHEGVLGIVSSIITNRYNKPSMVISEKNGIAKGSARSLEYLNIYDALYSQKELLIKFGGHKLAGGFSLYSEKLDKFSAGINQYVSDNVNTEEIIENIYIDSVIEVNDINRRLYENIKMFEPFGHGNEFPVFYIKNYEITNLKLVGADKNHVSFNLKGKKTFVKSIAFNYADKLGNLFLKPQGIVININENNFRNTSSIQANIINIDCNEYLFEKYTNDCVKALDSSIISAKSRILKVNIFDLVNKLNQAFNMHFTPSVIISILYKEKKYQYVLKKDTLYIKK